MRRQRCRCRFRVRLLARNGNDERPSEKSPWELAIPGETRAMEAMVADDSKDSKGSAAPLLKLGLELILELIRLRKRFGGMGLGCSQFCGEAGVVTISRGVSGTCSCEGMTSRMGRNEGTRCERMSMMFMMNVEVGMKGQANWW